MRRIETVGLLLGLCAVVPRISSAQVSPESLEAKHRPIDSSAQRVSPLLLNSDEGLTILAAALESRQQTDPNADCSHLVHQIYERAGYSYSYANSIELYDGRKEFRRVTRPQPGDLVVWRGHAGIVISPQQHSFFSAMHSGHGVEIYDSPYWAARGRPRFFRYQQGGPATLFSASNRNSTSDLRSSRSSDEPVAANTFLSQTVPKPPTAPVPRHRFGAIPPPPDYADPQGRSHDGQ